MSHTQRDELHRYHNSVGKENEKGKLHSTPSSVDLPKCPPESPSTEVLWNFGLPWPTSSSPEIPNLPLDWWHTDIGIKIINGTGDLWAGDRIPFISDHGILAYGVSMERARLGIGMIHGHTLLSDWVHPMLFHIPYPMLSIQWPGYQSIQESFCEHDGLRPLNIKRPLYLDKNCTLAQLAQQVADYFFEFSEVYGEHCNLTDPKALLLGPGGIAFDRLRLIKLWTSNQGIFWNAEIAIVHDYMRRY
ncbi:hypothetical protein B0H12DRAFT_1125436 [Mycena haematopus]|nr:hypothetical protein B0H12DRAFT_1125436 [Mycena haematopus]